MYGRRDRSRVLAWVEFLLLDFCYLKGVDMRAPTWLSKEAKQYWRRLVSRVNEQDADLLIILCCSLANYRQAQKEIDEYGLLINTIGGDGKKQNPAIPIQRQEYSKIIASMKALKLTPQSRGDDPLDDDPLAAFESN